MIPALIAAGASILGGVMANRSSAKQAAAANEMSWEQMHAQNAFNATQAEVDFTRSRQSMHEANALNLSNMEAAHNYQRAQNAEQMLFQDSQAKQQMAFQERLSNSAHQREVNDLRLAGLNPILSGTGGMGSITPGGAMGTGHAGGPSAASVSAPQARGYGSGSASFQQARLENVISPAVSTALQTSRAIEEIELTRDQQQRTKAETLRTLAEGRTVAVRAEQDEKGYLARERELGMEKSVEETKRTAGESQSARTKGQVDAEMMRAEREAALGFLAAQSQNMRATARSAETRAGLDERLSEYERLINMGEGATSALSNLVPKIKLWRSPKTEGKEFSLGR